MESRRQISRDDIDDIEELTTSIVKALNKILQLSINGELVKEFKSTKEAAIETGFSIECIRMAARSQYSKRYTNVYRGYIWKQKSPL